MFIAVDVEYAKLAVVAAAAEFIDWSDPRLADVRIASRGNGRQPL